MGYNPRANPMAAHTGTFGSVATDSSALLQAFTPFGSGQVLGARFINGITSTVASGTTAGSSLNIYVHKTASDAGSIVASARLGAVATLGTSDLTVTTSTALSRFVDGDVLIGEFRGGAGNDVSNAGCRIQVSYMYAYNQG